MKIIKRFKGKQNFNPNFLGILVNPYFIVRYNIFKGIKKFASKFKRGNLLDFGCGSKPYRDLFDVDHYVGIDIQKENQSTKNKEIDIIYDGKKIPFDNSYFDYIISSEVLEHVFNLDKIIKELNRVLKVNGKMLITIPFVWGEHEQPLDFARYTSFGFEEILKRNGFEVVDHIKTTSYLETIFQLITSYIYHNIIPKGLKTLLTILLIAPLNLLGIILGKILPKDETLYLNNIFFLKKNDIVKK